MFSICPTNGRWGKKLARKWALTYPVFISDVKRGQFLESEAEAEDKFSESKDNL